MENNCWLCGMKDSHTLYICDSCMVEHIYKGHKNILVTDEVIAVGDKMHLFSSVGRFKYLVPDGKVFYVGDIIPMSFKEQDGVRADKLFIPLHFSYNMLEGVLLLNFFNMGGFGEDIEVISANDSHIVFVNKLLDYIDSNNISAFYFYNITFSTLLQYYANKRGIACEFLNQQRFYRWGLAGKAEFLSLTRIDKSYYVDNILLDRPRPYIVYHFRNRPWADRRNPDPNQYLPMLEEVCAEFAGTLIRFGVCDQWYAPHTISDDFRCHYVDFCCPSLLFNDQCYLISLADIVIDIESVAQGIAGELGIPTFQLNKGFTHTANIIKDRYCCNKVFAWDKEKAEVIKPMLVDFMHKMLSQ